MTKIGVNLRFRIIVIAALAIFLSQSSPIILSASHDTAYAQTPNQCPRVIAKRQKLRAVCQSAKGGPEACREAMRAIALMDQGIGRYCPGDGVVVPPDVDPSGGDGPDDTYDPVGEGEIVRSDFLTYANMIQTLGDEPMIHNYFDEKNSVVYFLLSSKDNKSDLYPVAFDAKTNLVVNGRRNPGYRQLVNPKLLRALSNTY